MSDKIYYKLSNTEVYDDGHFYKMFRFVWFKMFIFCIDIYPDGLNFSFMIGLNDLSIPVKSFNLWSVK